MAPFFSRIQERSGTTEPRLVPGADVVVRDRTISALSNEPWLDIDFEGVSPAGIWIEVVYEASLIHALARPMLEIDDGVSTTLQVLPAPMGGRGLWIGYAPSRKTRWRLSPTDRKGAFNFRLTSIRKLSFRELYQRCAISHCRLAFIAFCLGIAPSLAEGFLAQSLNATTIERFGPWIAQRRRTPDWEGIDAVRIAGATHFRILGINARATDIDRIRTAFADQPHRAWSVKSIDSKPYDDVGSLISDSTIEEHLSDLRDSDFILTSHAGDAWKPESLATLDLAIQEGPVDILYADEESEDGQSVWLKPEWDALLARSLNVTGRACAYRVGWLRNRTIQHEHLTEDAHGFVQSAAIIARHVPRLLLTRTRLEPPRTLSTPMLIPSAREVSVIIPTRDRVDLLGNCVDGLRKESASFRATIVDNDSAEPETQTFLRDLRRDSRFEVVRIPGPFNFSALCNAVSRDGSEPTLLFLNNDVKAMSKGWLNRLAGWTIQPEVAAVGPKLLYPDGRVQHAGVVIGIKGYAAHFERGLPARNEGFFGRLNRPHAVSAVTGACLAVAHDKFWEVGGFDAENLPIELNDIDLCLRFRERGWINVLDPAIELIHFESASRGAHSLRPRYQKEKAYFRTRWRSHIRSDAYFHPALSLNFDNPRLS